MALGKRAVSILPSALLLEKPQQACLFKSHPIQTHSTTLCRDISMHSPSLGHPWSPFFHICWFESMIGIRKALEAFQRQSIPLHWLQGAGETRASMIQQSQQNRECICLTLEERVWKPSNALTSSQPIRSAAFHPTLTSACWTTAKQSAKDKNEWIQRANLSTTSSPKPLFKWIC